MSPLHTLPLLPPFPRKNGKFYYLCLIFGWKMAGRERWERNFFHFEKLPNTQTKVGLFYKSSWNWRWISVFGNLYSFLTIFDLFSCFFWKWRGENKNWKLRFPVTQDLREFRENRLLTSSNAKLCAGPTGARVMSIFHRDQVLRPVWNCTIMGCLLQYVCFTTLKNPNVWLRPLPRMKTRSTDSRNDLSLHCSCCFLDLGWATKKF